MSTDTEKEISFFSEDQSLNRKIIEVVRLEAGEVKSRDGYLVLGNQ